MALAFFLKFFNGKLFRPSKPHHKFAHLLFWGSGWGRQKKCNFISFYFLFFTYYHSFSLIISNVYLLFLIFTYFFHFLFLPIKCNFRGDGKTRAGRKRADEGSGNRSRKKRGAAVCRCLSRGSPAPLSAHCSPCPYLSFPSLSR